MRKWGMMLVAALALGASACDKASDGDVKIEVNGDGVKVEAPGVKIEANEDGAKVEAPGVKVNAGGDGVVDGKGTAGAKVEVKAGDKGSTVKVDGDEKVVVKGSNEGGSVKVGEGKDAVKVTDKEVKVGGVKVTF